MCSRVCEMLLPKYFYPSMQHKFLTPLYDTQDITQEPRHPCVGRHGARGKWGA